VIEDALVVRSDVWPVYLHRRLPAPLARWAHVAFTRAADGTLRLYENGERVAEAHTSAASAEPVDTALFLGATRRPGGDRFHVMSRLYGSLDEVAVYDRALSDQEIAALARGHEPP
jgi:Concanavalin A-like lectin/glucanases superfamily